jgi:hypothetical protein
MKRELVPVSMPPPKSSSPGSQRRLLFNGCPPSPRMVSPVTKSEAWEARYTLPIRLTPASGTYVGRPAANNLLPSCNRINEICVR